MAKLVFGYNFGKLSVALVKFEGQKLGKEDWVTLDPTTLSEEVQEAYGELKAARKLAQEARVKFETMMGESVGIKPEDKPKPVAKKAQSLADFLAQQG